MLNIERCSNCKKLYRVEELSAKMPGPTGAQEIICPYCYSSHARASKSSFITFKLTPEQEKGFLGKGD